VIPESESSPDGNDHIRLYSLMTLADEAYARRQWKEAHKYYTTVVENDARIYRCRFKRTCAGILMQKDHQGNKAASETDYLLDDAASFLASTAEDVSLDENIKKEAVEDCARECLAILNLLARTEHYSYSIGFSLKVIKNSLEFAEKLVPFLESAAQLPASLIPSSGTMEDLAALGYMFLGRAKREIPKARQSVENINEEYLDWVAQDVHYLASRIAIAVYAASPDHTLPEDLIYVKSATEQPAAAQNDAATSVEEEKAPDAEDAPYRVRRWLYLVMTFFCPLNLNRLYAGGLKEWIWRLVPWIFCIAGNEQVSLLAALWLMCKTLQDIWRAIKAKTDSDGYIRIK